MIYLNLSNKKFFKESENLLFTDGENVISKSLLDDLLKMKLLIPVHSKVLEDKVECLYAVNNFEIFPVKLSQFGSYHFNFLRTSDSIFFTNRNLAEEYVNFNKKSYSKSDVYKLLCNHLQVSDLNKIMINL